MEQSKGLEEIKTEDMEVRLWKDQPWKRDPVKPVKLSWFNPDVNQSVSGVDTGQSSSSKDFQLVMI